MTPPGSRRLLSATLFLALGLAAQSTPDPTAQGTEAQRGSSYEFEYANIEANPRRGDFGETFVYGGFIFRWPDHGLEVRGGSGIVLTDRQSTEALLRGDDEASDVPTRGLQDPQPRRSLTPEVLHARINRLLAALGRPPIQGGSNIRRATETPRLLYFEDDVIVIRDGIEVARCARLWISPLDDRIVIEGAELRFVTPESAGRSEQTLILRGDRIVKQGPRWTGVDLQVTTCEAGKPHIAVASGELELIEREGQFELRSRGNRLQLYGVDVLPLPDAKVFTGEQCDIPIKSFSMGFSGREGARVRIGLGRSMNDFGGSIHHLVTGREAREFRGDWELGLGYVELRGAPIDGATSYSARTADGRLLYEGIAEGFYMDDDGPNIREIRNNLDGSLITDRNRNLLRTRNRVHLGETTHLDLTAFHAGDAAVYPEFFRADYRNQELPETSAYLHHRDDNLLVTINGRFNLSEFSYRDDRALADYFVEELPVATLDWISEPIAETPWQTPIVLDATTEIGQRRRKFDPRSPLPQLAETTTRIDQMLEFSAPWLLGPVHIRPFVRTRWTWYDEDNNGDSLSRGAFTAGVRVGTRLSRTFHRADGGSLRHVISPQISWMNRFQVTEDPAQIRQYDEIDALEEQSLLRFELRNLVQKGSAVADGADADESAPSRSVVGYDHDLVFLDLAQDVWTNGPPAGSSWPTTADRGHFGLFYYDLLVRPQIGGRDSSFLSLGLYGDHDWREGLRTFDAELGLGKLAGCDWFADFRTDAVVSGAVGLGARSQLFGRWSTYGRMTYDTERSEWLRYGFGMRRDDHDWSVLFNMDYDPFDDEVTFRVAVEPSFGRPTRLRYNAMDSWSDSPMQAIQSSSGY